jgi:hypothetical protein
MGVNVISTAFVLGIDIEPRPKRMVHAIALLGYSSRAKADSTRY